MAEIQHPLGGMAIYNPSLLDREECRSLFVARQSLLQRILADISAMGNSGQGQHRLLLGSRGMGKTTLLHRLALEIEEHPALQNIWLPLLFPEEQYSVACLGDFWLNCLDALGDALERRNQLPLLHNLDQQVERLQALAPAERAKQGLAALLQFAQQLERRLLLLVDNIDLILERIRSEEWSLREVLGHSRELLLLGASSRMIESSYQYNGAFYDFFKIDELRGLTLEEVKQVMRALDARQEGRDKPGNRLINEDPGRLRALYVLTDGNPRTIVLLYGVLLSGWGEEIRGDLARLLDQVTPLYKARFEEMAPQAQQVLDALALHWHPMTAQKLAETARLEVNSVSAQLHRLVIDGVVEKVELPDSKRTGFQVAERFFNIWYLMRASRRLRQRLSWLVEFLRLFYSSQELAEKANRHLRAGTHANGAWIEEGLAYARALGSEFSLLTRVLERSAVQKIFSQTSLMHEYAPLLDLTGEDQHLSSIAERHRLLREAKESILAAPPPAWKEAPTAEELWNLIGGSFTPASVKHGFAIFWNKLPAEDQVKTFSALLAEWDYSLVVYSNQNHVEQIYRLLREGVLDVPLQLSDIAIAIASENARQPNSGCWLLLFGLSLTLEKHTPEQIAMYSKKAKEVLALDSSPVLRLMMARYLWNNANKKAEGYFTEAINLMPDHLPAKYMFGLYLMQEKRWHEAAHYWLPVFSAKDIGPPLLLINTFAFIKLTAQQGHGKEVLQLIEQIGMREQWLPLWEAIRAYVNNNPKQLNSLAPEIRTPALEILQQLNAPKDAESQPKSEYP
ncbi:ATP-binding protein [Candidatus Magnetaquicoccus inordinatus]|uniref:ATP-binding protein n=1 Tax=Candidatus Magnetaquicoccus inordinatus TaxID=2496818 RepID=UPI00187D44C1|nr:ATP-binding protein [Candidatus Magnetaquicoccus inordinatus]